MATQDIETGGNGSENHENGALTSEVRARVPKWMKAGVALISKNSRRTGRLMDEADVVREAVAEYLERRAPEAVPAQAGKEVEA